MTRYEAARRTLEELFAFDDAIGSFPDSQPILHKNVLYGTASSGGAFGKGVLYKYDLKTGTYTDVWDFGKGTDGATPIGAPAFDTSGNLFGTTETGGQFGDGTLYEIDKTGTETVVHSFDLSTEGGFPTGAVYFDPKTLTLYGTCAQSVGGGGMVWSFKP